MPLQFDDINNNININVLSKINTYLDNLKNQKENLNIKLYDLKNKIANSISSKYLLNNNSYKYCISSNKPSSKITHQPIVNIDLIYLSNTDIQEIQSMPLVSIEDVLAHVGLLLRKYCPKMYCEYQCGSISEDESIFKVIFGYAVTNKITLEFS